MKPYFWPFLAIFEQFVLCCYFGHLFNQNYHFLI
nr:MAG TPA: hypothetical protein [Caudoviricetes sp.]